MTLVDTVQNGNMNAVTSNAVANILNNYVTTSTFTNTPIISDITDGKIISFPNGLKFLSVKVDWSGDTGVSNIGSATVVYSLHRYEFPSAFNITTLLSANVTSADVGSGVPCAVIESIGNGYIEIDDWGYNSTTASSTSSHSVFLFLIGI